MSDEAEQLKELLTAHRRTTGLALILYSETERGSTRRSSGRRFAVSKIGAILKRRFSPTHVPIYRCGTAERQAAGRRIERRSRQDQWRDEQSFAA